jgi:hypothetical protein
VPAEPTVLAAALLAAWMIALMLWRMVAAPLCAARLPPDVAQRWIERLQQSIYAGGIVMTAIATGQCLSGAPAAALLTGSLCVLCVLTRQALLPAAAAARDAAISSAELARRSQLLHRAGLAVDLVQVVLLPVAIALALAPV